MEAIYNRLKTLVNNDLLRASISYNESCVISGFGRGNEFREYYLSRDNKVLFYSIVRTAEGMDTQYECFIFGGSTPVTNQRLERIISEHGGNTRCRHNLK